jgi:SAM-dependent methyltransferase
MSRPEAHWDTVYGTKAPDAVSWYREHLELSLELIQKCSPSRNSAVIDVGGGESTLADDLLRLGYRDITVLDVSAVAVEVSRKRLGDLARFVSWQVADITSAALPEAKFDVWHDRAVFHFLTEEWQRRAYVRRVAWSMKPGGCVMVATFGPDGPRQCSGLDVLRYDAHSLHREFGSQFELVESDLEVHKTPWGSDQQFVYCLCKVA